MAWYVWVVLVLCVFALLTYVLQQRVRLKMKYRDEELVDSLVQDPYWRGQTADQLRASLGEPLEIDQKVLKGKLREVWKYKLTGRNRYGLKIVLEDGLVVRWER